MPLAVQVVKNGEVLDQLFDVWTEVASTGRTRENIASAQIHEAVLAESVAACQDPGNLVFVVVLIKANGASDFHSVMFKRVYQLGGGAVQRVRCS